MASSDGGALIEVQVYSALSGELIAQVSLPEAASVLQLRREIVSATALPRSLRILSGGVILDDARTISDVGLSDMDAPWVSVLVGRPTRLATGSGDCAAKIWDVESGACLHTLEGHAECINAVGFSADGELLGTGSKDGTAKIWSVATAECLRTIDAGGGEVLSLAFDCVGAGWVGVANMSRLVAIWDALSGDKIMDLEGHVGSVIAFAFSPIACEAASGSTDGDIILWDVCAGEEKKHLCGHRDVVFRLLFSTDGETIVSSSRDYTVKVWRPSDGTCVTSIRGHAASVRAACLSFSGARVVTAAGRSMFNTGDCHIRVWDAQSGVLQATFQDPQGHTQYVWSLAASPDGTTIASGSGDRKAKLWDLETGTLLQTLVGHEAPILFLCFSPP